MNRIFRPGTPSAENPATTEPQAGSVAPGGSLPPGTRYTIDSLPVESARERLIRIGRDEYLDFDTAWLVARVVVLERMEGRAVRMQWGFASAFGITFLALVWRCLV